MASEHMTDNEVAKNFDAVLEKIRKGVDVIVERNHRPVAVITPPPAPGRKISECIALARAYEDKLGYQPTPDLDFAKDVEDGIATHREPLDPPSWD
jgi:antitoxin (DNA-binding transcriptional repressor) of toxin-antitoxin stability system